MRRLAWILLAAAAPAAGQVRAVPEQPASAAAAERGVDVFLINEGEDPVTAPPPAELRVGAADAAPLALVPDDAAPVTIAPGGFAKLRYRPVIAAPAQPALAAIAPERVVETSNGRASGFWDRLQPHEPIYGVFGTGDAGSKLQFSLGLRPFGGGGLLSHLVLAYTQTMFWAIDRPSGPFRQTTYSPEAFVDMPVGERLTLGAGYRHDSNGRGLPGSIDVNRLYVRAAARFDLGEGWSAELVPQAWYYIDHRGARRLDRYWGFTQLKASVGQRDGVKLALTVRGNPDSGRGAAELFASYPLAGVGDGIGLYLFGQGFTGYGEALDDFRVRDSHARLGIALTR